MDVEIVNRILRLCFKEEICVFDMTVLFDACRDIDRCSDVKYIRASMRNYPDIFRISQDRKRMEFVMPFEICRKNCVERCGLNGNNLCKDLHVCYEYFHQNLCPRAKNCTSCHELNESNHRKILGLLIHLDLHLLTEAFRMYCRIHKYQNVFQSRPINGSIVRCSSSKMIEEKGVQICWKPDKEIPRHFIDVIFGQSKKSQGGTIRSIQFYQHLGVAQVFYEDSDCSSVVDRVVAHGCVTFQTFTFIPRLLQRTIDRRHLALSNLPLTSHELDLYIEKISPSSRKFTWEYYQNDPGIILIEYDDDIDFAQIYVNLRQHPEYQGSIIHPIQLYLPEILLLEYDSNPSEDEIRTWFSSVHLFHIRTYSFCCFVHFFSHQDLQQSMQKSWTNLRRISPIYIDLYSSKHLDDYLHQREIDRQRRSSICDDADDFHDLPSEFDEDDLNLDETEEKNPDIEFFRKTAENLLTTLEENQDKYKPQDKFRMPFTMLFADDYIVTFDSGIFALSYLNYTEFLVKKQENLDRINLITSLKKPSEKKKPDQMIERKNSRKKKSKSQPKKKKDSLLPDQNESIQHSQ